MNTRAEVVRFVATITVAASLAGASGARAATTELISVAPDGGPAEN